jgi:hypothetical protein
MEIDSQGKRKDSQLETQNSEKAIVVPSRENSQRSLPSDHSQTSQNLEPQQTQDTKGEKKGLFSKIGDFYNKKPVLANVAIFTGAIALGLIPVVGPALAVGVIAAQSGAIVIKIVNDRDKAKENLINSQREMQNKSNTPQQQTIDLPNDKGREPGMEQSQLTQAMQKQSDDVKLILDTVREQSQKIKELQAQLSQRNLPTLSERERERARPVQPSQNKGRQQPGARQGGYEI